MAKDPAFLFYPNDWLGGTMGLTRHQKGCYVDLLVAQFNSGPLSLETIKTVLGPDQATWTVLSSKFKTNSEGNFFNERLESEIKKRKNYSESRRSNARSSKKDEAYVKAYAQHMPKHMENRNENEITSSKAFIENEIWREQFAMTHRLATSTVKQLQERFIKDCELRGEPVSNYHGYFVNCWNKGMIKTDWVKGLKV